MKQRIHSLLRDQRGANLVEYIIVLGLVALIAISAFDKFGSGVKEKVGQQTEALQQINGQAK